MGVPHLISHDVPGRCLLLIERLLPEVRQISITGEERLGPLETTFLFAMSTLIFSLPIERLERHRRKEERGEQGYVDDRPLAPQLARDADLVLGNASFRGSPFFADDEWRFASIKYAPHHNLALAFPDELAAELGSDKALMNAGELSTRAWVNCLRNALSHGGILYLDAEGRQTDGRPTEMLGFVSAIYPNGNMRLPPERLIALRTTREAYLSTLQRWVWWLQSSGLSDALAA